MSERKTAMLTETDREYLEGQLEYDSRQADHNRHQSIKTGIERTLTDFKRLSASNNFEATDFVEFESRREVISQLAPIITVVEQLSHNVGVPVEEVIKEGTNDASDTDIDQLAQRLMTGIDPQPEELMMIVRALQLQPDAFAEVFSDKSEKVKEIQSGRELTSGEIAELTRELAQRDLTMLWTAILEARDTSYDEDTLHELKELTERAHRRQEMGDTLGEKIERANQKRDTNPTAELTLDINENDELDDS